MWGSGSRHYRLPTNHSNKLFALTACVCYPVCMRKGLSNRFCRLLLSSLSTQKSQMSMSRRVPSVVKMSAVPKSQPPRRLTRAKIVLIGRPRLSTTPSSTLCCFKCACSNSIYIVGKGRRVMKWSYYHAMLQCHACSVHGVWVCTLESSSFSYASVHTQYRTISTRDSLCISPQTNVPISMSICMWSHKLSSAV